MRKSCRELGWSTIRAEVIDVASMAQAEFSENVIRKDFVLSERDAIRRTIEAELKQIERRGGDLSGIGLA